MKPLALSACIAVACIATAADLKDPATVAKEWNQTIAGACEPFLSDGPLGLTVTPPASPATPPVAKGAPAPRGRRSGDVMEVPPGWKLDPGFEREVPGAAPPKGAKPWYYRGQKFWLIPIATTDK